MNHRSALAGAGLALAACCAFAQSPQYTYRAFYGEKGNAPTITSLASNGAMAGNIWFPSWGASATFAYIGGRQVVDNKSGSDLAAIDTQGNTTGIMPTGAGPGAAFLPAGGQPQALMPGYAYWSGPRAMNSHDVIVGQRMNAQGGFEGFMWKAGQVTVLPTPGAPADYYGVQPMAINDAGTIVGLGYGSGDAMTAYAWIGGVFQQLPALDPLGAAANGVSSTGTIVGSTAVPSTSGSEVVHACLWRDGKIVDLGAPLGASDSKANGVNAAGDVVGDTLDGAPDYSALRGVIWRGGDAGAAVALDTLVSLPAGWRIVSADFINDAGQIVATAQTGTRLVTLLLTPVAR